MEKLAFFIFIRHTVYGILEPISKFHSGSQRTRFLAVTLRFRLEISRYSSPSTSRFAIKIKSLGSQANFLIGSIKTGPWKEAGCDEGMFMTLSCVDVSFPPSSVRR